MARRFKSKSWNGHRPWKKNKEKRKKYPNPTLFEYVLVISILLILLFLIFIITKITNWLTSSPLIRNAVFIIIVIGALSLIGWGIYSFLNQPPPLSPKQKIKSLEGADEIYENKDYEKFCTWQH